MALTVADVAYDKGSPPAQLALRYANQLQNCPGFSIIGLEVRYPPGGATPPHRHGGADVSVVVLAGSVYNKMNNEPTCIIETGETWHEHPGCHHKTSANASTEIEAVFLVSMVVETETYEQGGLAALVVIDEEYR